MGSLLRHDVPYNAPGAGRGQYSSHLPSADAWFPEEYLPGVSPWA